MPVAKGNEARISNLRQIHFQIFLATQLYIWAPKFKNSFILTELGMFFKNEGHIPFVSYPEFRKNFTTEKCFGQSNGFKKDQTIIVLSENA